MSPMSTETFQRIVIERTGGPEVMTLVPTPVRHAAADEVRVRHEAIGVDFIDTQIRAGLLPATLPTGLGFAAVGIAEEVGEAVTHVKRGDRVATMYFVPGSYAQERVVPGERVVALPDPALSPALAAGALFRGLTAWYLTQRLWRIAPGDVVLVHAAAGGVGLILTQWLLLMGATVVGTVGSDAKAALLREYGCEHVCVIPREDFVAKVKQVSGGRGAAVVYDCIGQATFAGSLDSARRFGLVVSFGWPSGDPGSVSLMDLRSKGSLFVTRPTVTQYTADTGDLREGVATLFELVQQGRLRIKADHTYALRDAARAHEDLASGRTTGSVVLIA